MTKNVLLTVSGIVDQHVERSALQGERPRADYVELARTFDAELMDYAKARQLTGRVGAILERVAGPACMLAWACFIRRRDYKVVFTDGEQVGIPLALLFLLTRWHQSRHLMIVHILSVKKKQFFFDWFDIQRYIHIFFVYSTWQKQFIEQRWNVPSERVVFTPFMVDAEFFSRARVSVNEKPQICAVGLEFRDYPSLIRTAATLPCAVIIAAASPWSKRTDTTAGEVIPSNVHVQRFSQFDLRQVYADSRFLVMPLYDVDFQAGVTAILEAMSMERAVICTRTKGQTDVIVDGETGIYVPPDDPAALGAAITYLWNNPDEAARMGHAGRLLVEREMSLDCYVDRLHGYVKAALESE